MASPLHRLVPSRKRSRAIMGGQQQQQQQQQKQRQRQQLLEERGLETSRDCTKASLSGSLVGTTTEEPNRGQRIPLRLGSGSHNHHHYRTVLCLVVSLLQLARPVHPWSPSPSLSSLSGNTPRASAEKHRGHRLSGTAFPSSDELQHRQQQDRPLSWMSAMDLPAIPSSELLSSRSLLASSNNNNNNNIRIDANGQRSFEHPSMLLGESFFSPMGSQRTTASKNPGSPASVPPARSRSEKPLGGEGERRVLGFDAFALGSTRDRPASEERWTGDEAVPERQPRPSGFFPAPGLTWKNSPLGPDHSDAGPLFPARDHPEPIGFSGGPLENPPGVRLLRFSSVLPAWFPWIPTKSQIWSLKAKELREACSQRGLAKSGNKPVLRERLWEWTTEHQIQHQARLSGDYLTNWFEEDSDANDPNAFLLERRKQERQQHETREPSGNVERKSENELRSESIGTRQTPDENGDKRQAIDGNRTPNSLAEWSRSVDTDMFKKRREEIHRRKRIGKKPDAKKSHKHSSMEGVADTPEATRDYLRRLSNAMNSSPSSPYASNNKDARELYDASKKADQLGETELAISLLESLLEITPKDARLYRRLARMHNDQGNSDVARATLQKGLRLLPDNPWLWHGMGHLELSHGRTDYGVRCYQRAIQEDPSFAHSYHAWGIHEFSEGNIAKAMKILKKGIEYCPTNHRLHHALGDLYRGAKLLKDAERCYKRALEEGPAVSHGFALSALANVAYELGNVDEARLWLYQSIESNNGRHAQGWLALAQLEEAEGSVEQALTVCEAAIIRYEKELIDARKRYKRDSRNSVYYAKTFRDPTRSKEVREGLMESVPKYRSGDKFLSVFRHWARLEGRYGTHDGTNRVYERASAAFPASHRISLDWALYHAKLHNVGRARSLFGEACSRASNLHADPYREYASFEMSIGEFEQARIILFRGAQAVTRSPDGGLGDTSGRGLAQLYVTWAVCEWHLGNIPRVEVLFDHALRLTEVGSREGSELRSFILFCIARLEYYERDELYLAQHCIGLCLKENSLCGGNAPVWKLWAKVARDMGNHHMEDECRGEARRCGRTREGEAGEDTVVDAMDVLKESQNMKNLLRQQPWHDKLQTARGSGPVASAAATTTPPGSIGDFCAGLRIPTRRKRRRRSDRTAAGSRVRTGGAEATRNPPGLVRLPDDSCEETKNSTEPNH